VPERERGFGGESRTREVGAPAGLAACGLRRSPRPRGREGADLRLVGPGTGSKGSLGGDEKRAWRRPRARARGQGEPTT
jgi:hypothetical protein